MFESLFTWKGLDSLPSILGANPVVEQSPRLEDPSTLSLAFTCLGTLAVYFAVRRVITMVRPAQPDALSKGRLTDPPVVETASDGSSRGAA